MLDEEARVALWRRVVAEIETYVDEVARLPVSVTPDPAAIRARLAPFDFAGTVAPEDAVAFLADALRQYQVHTPHPRYFGLFNPAPATMSIAADALVAAFNPQMAAWSHNAFAAEAEAHLVRAFGARFGYAETDGTFCSGGAEANHTAVLTALTHAFPDFAARGARALAAQPVLYISAEGHHSVKKAARLCGLGTEAVRELPADDKLRLDCAALAAQIERDRAAGLAPFMLVATVGTTNAGIIDPLPQLADLAAEHKLWLHADAAWGGAAALVSELRPLVAGIEQADSITFDAHKWLSVPMAAGVYLTRHADILTRTFRVANAYMPSAVEAAHDISSPYEHSMQWSRRFIGAKVFLALAVAGWAGYAAAIRHQTEMGVLMRRELRAAGWLIVNETELPVVCFTDGAAGGDAPAFLDAVAAAVVSSGRAWLSTTRLSTGRRVLRACVTNFRTEAEDVRALVQALNEARAELSKTGKT
ncbi:MAG TPA: aminotransferase class V-fold PLP-dependent enzyme [Pyrinomonadaceae bacterium]|jgi:glutamate/tyrosine decarboxylase-like PLP-dependent enzyme